MHQALLKEFIANELLDGEDEDLTYESPLLEWGIIDSLGMTSVLSFMKNQFSVKVTADQVKPGNFKNINEISRWIEQLRLQATEHSGNNDIGHAALEELIDFGIECKKEMFQQQTINIIETETSDENPETWLILPPLGLSAVSMAPLIKSLDGFHHSITIDNNISLEKTTEYADWIASMLASKKNDNIVIVAVSTAALQLSELLSMLGNNVKHVILAGACNIKSQNVHEQLSSNVDKLFHRQPDAIDFMIEEIKQLSVEAFDSNKVARFVEKLIVPTTVICGDEDEITGMKTIEQWTALNSDIQVKTLLRCGHFAPLEMTSEFISLVKNSLI